jgi:SagB-type dehydrogenase family enzyme
MNHIELKNPVPKSGSPSWKSASPLIVKREYLPVPPELGRKSFSEILANRKSRRTFGPLSDGQLSALLWHSAKTRKSQLLDGELVWESRPAPSGGGVHPIDLIVIDRSASQPRFRIYDAISHSLGSFEVWDTLSTANLLSMVSEVLPIGNGVTLWFAAQFGKTMSRYDNGESLVWRDSGALLGVIYLVAEAIELSCCGIGITGDPMIQAIMGDKYRGVGGCVVGARVAE